jgi:hypothetical protein
MVYQEPPPVSMPIAMGGDSFFKINQNDEDRN